VQSFAGLERHYGREASAAIEAYADVRIYGGLNTLARAKYVSDLLAQETIVRQDVSYRSDVKDLGLADREMARPLMTPDEILAMPRDQAWAFIRGMRPVRIRLVTYAQVSPWRDWVDPSPITGTRLQAAPILHVEGTKRDRRDVAG
jgi:type IV secretion system protein VirD4